MTPYFIEPLTSILVTVAGLVFGSFLNVCIHRLPKGQSVVTPRSRCPKCGALIRAWHNVPVLSWVYLMGKCADCSAPISFRYPAVEALSGAVALATWLVYGPSVPFLLAVPYTWAMIVLFFTDWDERLLPDAVTLIGFVAGMAVAWFNPFLGEPGWSRVWMAASGAAVGAGFLWGVGALWTRLRGVEAMGMGDVKMMAFVGAFTGPQGVLFTIFAGSVVGALVGLALIPLRGGKLKDAVPFGCFLAPAAVAALHWSRPVVAWYLHLVKAGW